MTLPLTGERTLPGIWHERYWFARHEAVYRWIGTSLVRGRVLDAGCGEGYGADLLRNRGADRVVALDYDPATIRHVRQNYPEIACLQGNLVQLGLADQTFDLVVSLQTIEHLWDQPAFLAECHRVLRPGGILVLSTPNRLTFPSGNCYHTRELTADELVTLVSARLQPVDVRGLAHGPRLQAWDAAHGSCVDAQLAGEPDGWAPELADLVRSLTPADFEPTDDLDGCLDLLIVSQRTTNSPADRPSTPAKMA